MSSRDPDFIDVEVVSPGGKPGEGNDSRTNDPVFQFLARWLDDIFQIPGTNIRFGLDPLIGLIPGLGDTSGALVSTLLIVRGAQAGLPRIVLARMVGNVILNSVVGAIPVVGDLFSVWFKSNRQNYLLFEKHAGKRNASHRGDWLFVGALIAVLLIVVGTVCILSFLLVAALWRVAFGP